MAIADDISVATNGNIRWTGSTAYYTVLELHRFLQDLADDAQASVSGDDLLDITSETPSERSTDNIITLNSPYNIDDTLAERLFDGSITQDNGDTVYSGLVVVGAVETGTELQAIQDDALITSWWSTGINTDPANNILLRTIIKTRSDGADIDGKRLRIQARELGDTYAEFSLTLGLGNSTAAVFTGVDLNNQTASGTIATYDQFTNTEGFQSFDVTGDAVNEDYYSRWNWGAGTTPAAPTINDLYEWTKYVGRRGTAETIHSRNGFLFRGITGQFNWDGERAGGSPAEDSIIAWGTSFNYDNEASGPFTVGEYVSIGGASNAVGKLVYLDDQGATGFMVVALEDPAGMTVSDNDQVASLTGSATCDVNGIITGQTLSGGTGLLIANDDNGTTGTSWIQLLTGSNPSDNQDVYTQGSGTTVGYVVNGSVTARTISPEYLGTSTGTALIGAFGIGVEPGKLTASDQLFDLTNTLRVPPNNVTFSVLGLNTSAPADRVLVTPEDGAGGLDQDQLTLSTTLNGAAETAVVVTTAIPLDTPSSGTIRIELNNGVYRRVPYTSYTGSTFTIASTDFTGSNQATQPKNVYVSYIDKAAAAAQEDVTVVYQSDRTVFVRVRNGGTSPIKTFETTGTIGSAGGSSTAIRTSDA